MTGRLVAEFKCNAQPVWIQALCYKNVRWLNLKLIYKLLYVTVWLGKDKLLVGVKDLPVVLQFRWSVACKRACEFVDTKQV